MSINLKSANKGKSLEAAVIASQGADVCLEKTRAGVKWLRGGKQILQRGLPDYIGCVKCGGRMIVFDAKSSEDPAGFYLSKMPEHQRQIIMRFGDAGAIAGILVESIESQGYFWAEWELFNALRINFDRMVFLGDSRLRIPFNKIPGVSR